MFEEASEIVFEKLRFPNIFRSHENAQPALSNSSGFKNVFEKLRFHDGLVWTVGLNAELMPSFQVPPGVDGASSKGLRI